MWRMCSVGNRRQHENERSEFQAAFIWEQIAISVRCGYAMFNNGAWQATHPTCVVLTLRFHPKIGTVVPFYFYNMINFYLVLFQFLIFLFENSCSH